jgi:hypothetical protein
LTFAGELQAGICGNGVKEKNEQCDCGLKRDCRDACCDADTCTLKPGAACADGNDSCCGSCNILSAGTSCHVKNDICDSDLV